MKRSVCSCFSPKLVSVDYFQCADAFHGENFEIDTDPGSVSFLQLLALRNAPGVVTLRTLLRS
jgi:hypothetical protein